MFRQSFLTTKAINMKKILYLIALVIAAYVIEQKTGLKLFDNTAFEQGNNNSSQSTATNTRKHSSSTYKSIQSAYNNRQSDIQVQQTGKVVKILADDLKGSRHQKFILKFDQLSILVAHNIDLAPRIDRLRVGDSVEFYGEYEWNEKGGIVHWTHLDPAGRHINGWLKHKGKTYQ